MTLPYKFVEFIPDYVEEGLLYISMPYCTAIHRCMCGCGNEVVTPISRSGWKLTFDGESITLHPSIGNWKFNCRSHYWIQKSKIVFAEDSNDKAKPKEKVATLLVENALPSLEEKDINMSKVHQTPSFFSKVWRLIKAIGAGK